MIPATLSDVGTLRSLELWEVVSTLSTPVETAHGRHDSRRFLYVHLEASDGQGWGEVGALDEPSPGDPPLIAVQQRLIEHWFPLVGHAARMREQHALASQTIPLLGGGASVDNVAIAALEMAFLDAELIAASMSLSTWLAVTKQSVAFGGILGVPDNNNSAQIIEDALRLVDQGASRLRVKITPQTADATLSALREGLPVFALQGDANGSYSVPHFSKDRLVSLQELDQYELRCIEQPLAGNDLSAYAELGTQLATPIALDEGLGSVAQSLRAIRYGAASVFCVKPARLGGIRAALSVLVNAQEANVDCFLGGLFESGLGRSALGALAANPAATLVSDVSAPSLYLKTDPCGFTGPQGSEQPLWTDPGVGPSPDLAGGELLARFVLDEE